MSTALSLAARERAARAARLAFCVPLDPYPSSFEVPDLVLTSLHACSGSAELHRSLLVFLIVTNGGGGCLSLSVRSSIAVISMGACCGTLQQGDVRFDALSSDLEKIIKALH